MRKVLVTGSKGFVGSALCPALKRAGCRVEEADLPEFDITRQDAFAAYASKKFHRVFHLAGRTFVPHSWSDPAGFYRTNTDGTLNVLEYCRRTGVPLTFVSAYIYGKPDKLPIKETAQPRPNNPYAHSKCLAEELCRFYADNFGVPVTIVRPFNVYGPGQSGRFLIPLIIRQAVGSGSIRVQDLSPRRDYVHVEDLVRALLATIKPRPGLHIYNAGSGASRSVLDIVRTVCGFTGAKKVISAAARRRSEIPDTVADTARAARELGWKPIITFEEGIKAMVEREMGKEHMPINKGNYSMEPVEREEAFEKCRGAGWEKKYGLYRKNWAEYPKKHFVSAYPLLVDIELSSLCNLRCPMCYTITEKFKRRVNARLMDYALFTRLIDELGGKVPAIRLSLRGEPTLHPKFLQCVEYAKKKGVGEVSFLTNASTLSLANFKKMAAAGVDWITVSIDGLGKTYEGIRKPLKFPETLRKIKAIHAYKKGAGLVRPVIKVQSVWPAIKADPRKFYNTFSPYCDLIAFNPLIDYLGRDSGIVCEDRFVCPQQYQRLVIGADGRAMMCSNDEEGSVAVGDANKESVYDIWHGPALEKVRRTHLKKNGFMRIPVCRKCYLPRKTEDSETADINGRTVAVRNYVNRRQEIGK